MSEIKLGRCPLCQGETSMLGYIGDDYCKINYEEELEVAKHTTIHCYGCDTDFNPHSENAKDVLVIFNTRKPMERIVERLEKYKRANDMCRENAASAKRHENVRYFENLIFATEQAISMVKEEGGIE